VRDVSWHPTLPLLLTASWDASCGKWEYPGSVSDVDGKTSTPMPLEGARRHFGRRGDRPGIRMRHPADRDGNSTGSENAAARASGRGGGGGGDSDEPR
jgi:hypothetical protein